VFHLLNDGPGQASPVVVVSSFAGQLCPAISHTKQTKKETRVSHIIIIIRLFSLLFCFFADDNKFGRGINYRSSYSFPSVDPFSLNQKGKKDKNIYFGGFICDFLMCWT
jgi:hypothetical protein